MSYTFTYGTHNLVDLGDESHSLDEMLNVVRMYIYKTKKVVINPKIRTGTEHESKDLNLLYIAYTLALKNQSAWI
jgi:hypothetical protein